MKNHLLLVIAASVLLSCTGNNHSINRQVVARVGEKYLYLDEIPSLYNNPISPEDSISIVKNYIDRWVKKELILSRAEINLSPDYITEIDKKLEDTRANLMIFQYEQQMMLQRMDTIVHEQDIQDYYEKNIERFNLSASLVKAVFLKVPVEAPNIDRVRAWYRSNEQKDIQDLESYCYQFADKYDDFGEDWISITVLQSELPDDIGDPERFLRNNNHFETSDSLYHYFVNIRDYRLKGTIAPIEYVSADIRNVILNNRKLEFIQELENGIYNEALKGGSFRIF